MNSPTPIAPPRAMSWTCRSLSPRTRSSRSWISSSLSRSTAACVTVDPPFSEGRPGDAEAVGTQAAGDDLRGVVQDAHRRGGLAALRRVEVDRDRVALDRVDVQPVAEHGREPAARRPGADHDRVDPDRVPDVPPSVLV